MRLNYDPRYNVAYIRLREQGGEMETIRLSDEVNIDVAPDGTVYGIELLNANVQLGRQDAGHLLVVNEASGDRHDVLLTERT